MSEGVFIAVSVIAIIVCFFISAIFCWLAIEAALWFRYSRKNIFWRIKKILKETYKPEEDREY